METKVLFKKWMSLSVSTSFTVLLSLTLFSHFPLCTKSPTSKTSRRLTVFYKHSDCLFVWFGFSIFWQKAGENSTLNFLLSLVIGTFCISKFFQMTLVLKSPLTSAISGKFSFYSDAVLFKPDKKQCEIHSQNSPRQSSKLILDIFLPTLKTNVRLYTTFLQLHDNQVLYQKISSKNKSTVKCS